MKDKSLMVVGFFLIALAMLGMFVFKNRNSVQKRGTAKYKGPNNSARASDLRILTHQELAIQKQARKLIAKGQVIPAAQMLEQIGLHREAISALELANLIDEAAKVLLRMQKPTRAGIVYSRHGQWIAAAKCFLQGQNPVEAAKCYREGGQFAEAAAIFYKENMYADAAECYSSLQNFSDAARCMIKGGQFDQALKLWTAIGDDPSKRSHLKLSDDDIDLIFKKVQTGKPHPALVALLGKCERCSDLILTALETDKIELARTILEQTSLQTPASLLNDVNIQSPSAARLATVLKDLNHFRYAAMLYEQLGSFQEAADCFKLAGDEDRARYCLERHGTYNKKDSNKGSSYGSANVIANISAEPRKAKLGGNFMIESSAQLQAAEQAVVIENKNDDLYLHADDITTILSTDLMADVDDDEGRHFLGLFKTLQVKAGDQFQIGGSQYFLVVALPQNTKIDQPIWIYPGEVMTGTPAPPWSPLHQTKIAYLSKSDWDLGQTVSLSVSHHMLRNLTRQMVQSNNKPLKLKAI